MLQQLAQLVEIRSRFWIIVILLLLALLQYKLWLSPKGVPHLWKMEEDIINQVDLNQRLDLCNRELRAEVVDLKGGIEALEERARSDLGMVKQGELYVVTMVDGKMPASTQAKQGQCDQVGQ
ncbi:MAG: cell division protein FtsB [Gammaproteobacteria bacterium]|jgi:cell division protein FtsB|nr:cell division protein FtsB [Gammaproteobacteria bacterium]MBT3488396.1 cell division protein FtsB [Gammaproteobacteria bacterium]MBT3719629.1 cell division protein FtsB [Gammaproteobacteria bacterium]MBT3845051.1 cell division protein FtsB [Gammaproteobacteria bacterium]MBT3892388.1 cell division protein FtsB [Gammaproteobacteria bacterium]